MAKGKKQKDELIEEAVYCKKCAKLNKLFCKQEEDVILISKCFCEKCGTQLIFPFNKRFKTNNKVLIKYIISTKSFWFKLIWLALSMTFTLTMIFKVSDLIEKINTQDQAIAIIFALLLVILTINSMGRILRMPKGELVEEVED